MYLLNQKIKNESTMRILCPTDLSEHSLLALAYAIEMHNALGGELHVITTYTVKRTTGSMINISDVVRDNTVEDLEAVLKPYHDTIKTGVEIKREVLSGDAASVITAYARKQDMHTIVMGTQGSNSLKTMLFGSVTRKVSQLTTIPVIAVPNEAIDSHFGGNILLAVDDKETPNVEYLDPLINIAALTGQKIDVLHVDQEKDGLRNKAVLERIDAYLGSITVVEGQDPVAVLKRVAEQRKVSLLVMIKREKSFFQQLLTKGATTAEMGAIHVPLLIIPEVTS